MSKFTAYVQGLSDEDKIELFQELSTFIETADIAKNIVEQWDVSDLEELLEAIAQNRRK